MCNLKCIAFNMEQNELCTTFSKANCARPQGRPFDFKNFNQHRRTGGVAVTAGWVKVLGFFFFFVEIESAYARRLKSRIALLRECLIIIIEARVRPHTHTRLQFRHLIKYCCYWPNVWVCVCVCWKATWSHGARGTKQHRNSSTLNTQVYISKKVILERSCDDKVADCCSALIMCVWSKLDLCILMCTLWAEHTF